MILLLWCLCNRACSFHFIFYLASIADVVLFCFVSFLSVWYCSNNNPHNEWHNFKQIEFGVYECLFLNFVFFFCSRLFRCSISTCSWNIKLQTVLFLLFHSFGYFLTIVVYVRRRKRRHFDKCGCWLIIYISWMGHNKYSAWKKRPYKCNMSTEIACKQSIFFYVHILVAATQLSNVDDDDDGPKIDFKNDEKLLCQEILSK